MRVYTYRQLGYNRKCRKLSWNKAPFMNPSTAMGGYFFSLGAPGTEPDAGKANELQISIFQTKWRIPCQPTFAPVSSCFLAFDEVLRQPTVYGLPRETHRTAYLVVVRRFPFPHKLLRVPYGAVVEFRELLNGEISVRHLCPRC